VECVVKWSKCSVNCNTMNFYKTGCAAVMHMDGGKYLNCTLLLWATFCTLSMSKISNEISVCSTRLFVYQLHWDCKTDLLTLQCQNFTQKLVLTNKRTQGEEWHKKMYTTVWYIIIKLMFLHKNRGCEIWNKGRIWKRFSYSRSVVCWKVAEACCVVMNKYQAISENVTTPCTAICSHNNKKICHYKDHLIVHTVSAACCTKGVL
jgi:hypothetical protein